MSTRQAIRRLPFVLLLGGLISLVAISLALSDRGGPKTTIVNGHVVKVTLNEYSITPQRISVPAGPLRIVVHNGGVLAHNLTVEHERLSSRGEPVVIAASAPAGCAPGPGLRPPAHIRPPSSCNVSMFPGQTRVIEVPILNPGSYKLTSTLSNQADLGMTGTLIVR